MSFSCINVDNPEKRFNLNIHGWGLLLSVGAKHGWKAQGTKAPTGWKSKKWSGSYVLNDGQLVTEADAKSWAEAIEKARTDKELADFSQARLLEFVRFCQAGAFEIR